MVKCKGTESHEHFSLDTNTYVRHTHQHNQMSEDHTPFSHHSWEEHHVFTSEELAHEFEDTGRKVKPDPPKKCEREVCSVCEDGIRAFQERIDTC